MAYIQDWGMRVQAQPQINTTRRAFLHLSQNENGRMLNIRITDVNIPAGSTAVLAGTKPDGTVYSQAGTLAGNTATFAEDVQMTAVAGTWDAKITITNGGNCICTARITITIDPDTVAGGAIPSDSQLDGIIAECRAIADSVRKEAYGSPLVADAVEDMTDQSRVYVYTGSESGMTAGHWYYYNGSAWADGGVYNAVAVDTDTTLSIAGKAADAKEVGDQLTSVKEDLNAMSSATSSDVGKALKAKTVADGKVTEWEFGEAGGGDSEAIEEISDQLFVTAEVSASVTAANYRLNESDGFCSSNNAYQLKKYVVSVGTSLRIKSDDRFQFQNSSSVPTSGTSKRVGDTTYGAGTFHLTVPNGATYLIVSTPKANSVAFVETIEYKIGDIESEIQALEERTLKDSIAPYIAKYGNRIREIDLTSYLFDSKVSSIPFYNTATEKSDLNCPAQTVYQGIRLGTRILYLPKGSVVITNIDSVYDLSTMSFKNYPIGDRRGIILANYVNNNQSITGTIAYGREKFDGKYREIPIGYTDYYTLSYRTDVDYTNKLYVYYPKDHEIESDDVRVTDITADVRVYDGTVAYNAVSGWTDNTTSVNGAAGTYSNKSTFLHLMGNSGKSLYIDGMELYDNGTAYPTVIHYTDNGDDTYTPTTKCMTFNKYTVANHNYITIPLTDDDYIRVQFVATGSPAYMRFLIVPNELLFEKGLANPTFYGKKILGYGDSYIAGQGITYTWHYIIALQNYAEYVNRGHGGAGLCYGANGSLITSDKISELDEDADIYFLCFGRNDNSMGIAIGNNDDYPDTSVTWDSAYLLNHVSFKAGMNYLFEYLESRHPYAKIITVTPWGFENNAGVTSGLSCLDYIDAMQEMSKKWGITCFNAAGDAGIHVRIEAFRTQYFLASNDQSHLNNDGHALMAKRATKLLTNLLYDD